MAIIRLQSDIERQKRLYYEFDSSDKPLGEGGMGKVYIKVGVWTNGQVCIRK